MADESFLTVFDLAPDPKARVDIRRLPGLIRQGLRTIWEAGGNEFIMSSGLQVLSGLAVAAQLILANRALAALLATETGAGRFGDVVPWASAVAGVAALQFVSAGVQREQQQILGELVTRHVQGRLLDVAAAVELEAFESPTFHNRLQRTRLAGHQPLNLVFGLSGLVSAAVGAVAVVAALVTIEPLLLPLILFVVVPSWLVASRRGEAFFRFAWRQTPRDRERTYLASLLSDRPPAGEVRAFGLTDYLRRRYERLFDERLADLRQLARQQLRYSMTANLAIGLFTGGILLLIAWLTEGGMVSLAEAGAAVAGVAVIGARLTSAGWAAGSLSEAALYLEDYRSFVELLPRARASRASNPAPEHFRRIEVDRLSFTYPSGDKPALDEVSLEIRAGEVVALVGENGSGKTTLAKLLAGLYRPSKGAIYWDGIDVASVDHEQLRRSVAVIFQDFQHYHLPARDNIGLGRPAAIEDLEAIKRAAVQSGADRFIAELRDGYETKLGPEFEGGTDLSVGQWQRVALARAFFRDAPLVILDEPTAALDPRAEHDLFERIRSLLKGRTVLLISHRFSSVRSADRIYVLDAGRIIEGGAHEELMEIGGVYADLFSLQLSAYLGQTADQVG